MQIHNYPQANWLLEEQEHGTDLCAIVTGKQILKCLKDEDYLLNNRTVLACVIVYWFIKRRWWVLRYCVISLLREDVRY